jgi:FtsP/CotA-like multicopper oxidase with cupredoxin domain
MEDDDKKADTKDIFSRREIFKTAGLTGSFVGANLLLGKSSQAFAKAATSVGDNISHTAWPTKFDSASTKPIYPPRQKPKPGEKIHEIDMDLTITVHEIVPGVKIHAFTYNKTLPGPEIRVPEGDWVLVNFKNKTSELHEMDGVPNGTQWPVGPGQTFRYLFRAQPAGTHFYHCHNMTPLHVQAGMFGALIIEPKKDIVKEVFPYLRDYTLCLSEVDTTFTEAMMNDMLEMSDTMQAMSQSAKLMKEMNGRMMGWFYNKKAFLNAVKGGYIPPYVKAMTGLIRQPQFNFFMINGKSYPMTEEVLIKSGENIRVRFIGAGSMPHFMHIHGHDFWHVCQDGAPLANPVRLNTIPIFPGTTSDIIIQGTNPGHWHFHDHSDISTTNNGQFPGGMMTMLMYEDAEKAGVNVPEIIQVSS